MNPHLSILLIVLMTNGESLATEVPEHVQSQVAMARAAAGGGNSEKAYEIFESLTGSMSYRIHSEIFREYIEFVCESVFSTFAIEEMVRPIQSIWDCPPEMIEERLGHAAFKALTPTLVEMPRPNLPDEFLCEVGWVDVMFDVNSLGNPIGARPIRSSNKILEPFATEAAARSIWLPASFNGRSVGYKQMVSRLWFNTSPDDS